ncbi:MAG: hypothetical protein JW938_06755 [Candidatus Omnitrophica bacterium]|nr:hypothetical protein [Candidatus Omnitrophota bacterium]
MRKYCTIVVFSLVMGMVLQPTLYAFGGSVELKKAEIRRSVAETLAMLFEKHPEAREILEKSAGYAVFSNVGIKVFLLGGAWGSGIAHNNVSGEETFMNMREIHAGLGLNFRTVRLVFVFAEGRYFHGFVSSGWELGTHAAADADISDAVAIDDAIPVSPGVRLYQIIDDALTLELTVKGTKFSKNKTLNQIPFN